MNEQYDLKKSEEGIGQLYPILEAKDGEVIDGFHREEANKHWKRVRLEHIDTEEKKAIARIVGNQQCESKADLNIREINKLARIYQKQGYANMAEKIADATGLGLRTVHRYLKPEYKQKQVTERVGVPRTVASEVIRRTFDSQGEGYGERLVQRHRTEVLAEEKPKIEQEVKQKLLKNRDFQREVIREIQKPQIVTPSEACPSGVCELPPIVEQGEPVDVRAEAIEQFFQDNPECRCKLCPLYGKCGVIY